LKAQKYTNYRFQRLKNRTFAHSKNEETYEKDHLIIPLYLADYLHRMHWMQEKERACEGGKTHPDGGTGEESQKCGDQDTTLRAGPVHDGPERYVRGIQEALRQIS
jgi:hypothetical protein